MNYLVLYVQVLCHVEPYPHVLVTLLFRGVDTFCCIHGIQFQQRDGEEIQGETEGGGNLPLAQEGIDNGVTVCILPNPSRRGEGESRTGGLRVSTGRLSQVL